MAEPNVNDLVREVVFNLSLEKQSLLEQVEQLRSRVAELERRQASIASSDGASSPQEVETT